MRRPRHGVITMKDNELCGWKFIWDGLKVKADHGVGFILAPHIKLVDISQYLNARISSVKVKACGLRLNITNIYAPTNTHSLSAKQLFYNKLRKTINEISKCNKFKSIVIGDANATIGMNTKNNGHCDCILGSNNSNQVSTNENGSYLLNFCLEKKLKIVNSFIKTKRIHRGTWTHPPTGIIKQLDYILTRKQIMKLITSCRAYKKHSEPFCTDHYLLAMTLKIPKELKQSLKIHVKTLKREPKPIISCLRSDKVIMNKHTKEINRILSEA